MTTINFKFLANFDDDGNEVFHSGSVTTERYGKTGVRFHHIYNGVSAENRTDENGGGCWFVRSDGSESQSIGTIQFKTKSNLTQAAVDWARSFMSESAKSLGKLDFEVVD